MIARFGVFELDLDTGELSRQGRQVRLQHQPLQLLMALVERPGHLLTREELRRRLWPDGITVDFGQSLNKCVTKLRGALRDTAANPRFIETLPKRGYRFIAPVTVHGPLSTVHGQSPVHGPQSTVHSSQSTIDTADAVNARRHPGITALGHPGKWLVFAGCAAIAAMLLVAGASARPEALRPALAKGPSKAGASPIYAARDAYERGRLALARRSDESLRLGVEHFQRAIALSPRYAEAHVGLAEAWSLLSSYGLLDPREGMPRARDAANRALMLDAGLARAHTSLARTAMIFDWDWPTAEWHFGRALSLDGGDALTHQWYGYLLSGLGRHDEAIASVRRAVAAEPRSLNTNTALGYVLYVARRYDEAATELLRTLEIDPDFSQARRNLGLVRVQQGRIAEGMAALERVAAINRESPLAMGELAWGKGRKGERAEALRHLAELDALRVRVYVPPDAVALAQLGVGNRDEAVAWLQRAYTMRVATLAHLATEPVWDPLRDDPRIKEIIALIRLGDQARRWPFDLARPDSSNRKE